jgi:ankyrin repeat protein
MPLELLPLELLHLIVEFLDSKKDLSSLTRVSKSIHYRTYDILFKRYHSSALLWACENGIKKTAQLALTYFRDIEDKSSQQGTEIMDAFIRACEDGHVDLVKIMVTKRVPTPLRREGMEIAAEKGDNDLLRVFLEEGVDPNFVDSSHPTPLWTAANEGHLHTVKMLLDYGAAIDCVHRWHGSALMAAVIEGNQNIVRLLLDNGANINLVHHLNGETAVSMAARLNQKVIFEYLIHRGANATIQDVLGTTAWDEARRFLNDHQIQEMQLQQITLHDTINPEI